MNAAFFPYRNDYSYIIKSMNENLKQISIVAGIIPKGFSINVSSALPIPVFEQVQDVFDIVDAIVFFPIDNKKYLLEAIKITLRNKRNAVCFIDFSEHEIFELKQLADNSGVSFEAPDGGISIPHLQNRADVFTQQESIVIAVGGLTQGINTSSAVIQLRDILADRGYRVSIIGTKREACATGGFLLPLDLMIKSNLDQTIVLINQFFTCCQIVDHPDIVILQLPDEGLYRVSNDYETCFGAKTYLISQAVDVDYSMIISPVIEMDAVVFSTLSDVSQHRYGFGYNAIGISSVLIDMLVSSGTSSLRYLREDENIALNLVERLSARSTGDICYFSMSEDWQDIVADSIVETLS